MKNNIFAILLGLVLLISFTGCATIITGTPQQVTFQSSPNGATVKLNGRAMGRTPLTLLIEKKESMLFTVEKKRYKTYEGMMTSYFDPMLRGNVIFGDINITTTTNVSNPTNITKPRYGFSRGDHHRHQEKSHYIEIKNNTGDYYSQKNLG